MNVHEFKAMVRRNNPDLWRALHPRTYTGAAGWCAPDLPATALANECLWQGRGGPIQADDSGSLSREELSAMHIWYVVAAAKLVKNRMPTYHISRDLLSAVLQTNPPPGINWKTQELPMDAGIFLLPNRGKEYPAWLGWCRLQPGEQITTPGNWRQYTIPDNPIGFLVFAGNSPDEQSHDSFIITCGANGEFDASKIAEGVRPPGFNYAQIVGTTTSLLLAMLSRPELVERDGRKVRTIKNGPAREEWTPNWIGRTYRVQRAAGDGTHASPRLHWRRGHYRKQPCGAGRKEHKIIWLEPCLVGGDDDGNG